MTSSLHNTVIYKHLFYKYIVRRCVGQAENAIFSTQIVTLNFVSPSMHFDFSFIYFPYFFILNSFATYERTFVLVISVLHLDKLYLLQYQSVSNDSIPLKAGI